MLRLATLNLNYRLDGHGAWPIRRAAITDLLSQERPHVVALQAVEQDQTGLDQARELAEAAGYAHALYAAADQGKGSALITDREPKRIEIRRLSRNATDPDGSERVLVAAEFAFHGMPDTWVINAHCSWIPEQNRRNIEEALEFIGRLGGPALLLGDLNAAPGTPGHGLLRELGLLDVWEILRPASPGYTFSADRPHQRIDYVWADGIFRSRLRAADLAPRSGPPLSDHRALIVSLEDR
ncbi:MAG: endonuclease/exonuclease/phosphatase family protein [Acidiferrobacteraceae bacterium]